MDYFRKKQEIGGILLVFCSLNRTFARVMTSNSKTNIILALVALALAVLCVMSIVG